MTVVVRVSSNHEGVTLYPALTRHTSGVGAGETSS